MGAGKAVERGKAGMRRGQNFEKFGKFGFLTVAMGANQVRDAAKGIVRDGKDGRDGKKRLDLTKIPYGAA